MTIHRYINGEIQHASVFTQVQLQNPNALLIVNEIVQRIGNQSQSDQAPNKNQ